MDSPARGVGSENEVTTPAEKTIKRAASASARKVPAAKRKLEQGKQEEEEAKRAQLQQSENLEAALLEAAPSAAKVFDLLKAEEVTATLANVVTKLAIAAKARSAENNARVLTLWPSIEKQLEAQMAFSKNLKSGCRKQLKLEVPMVPAEVPESWLKKYESQDRIMVNDKGKKLVTDSASQLKFTANVALAKCCGWGRTSGSLVVQNGLTFTYCKRTRQLTITGKYGLGC